jgi:hypothetical protein
MARFEVIRRVAADPAGVALLLAEPASWPDPDHDEQVWLVALPRHVGSRFTAAVEVTETAGRLATGQVTVKPSTDAGSEIRLVIDALDDESTRVVERSAVAFLGLLAERAQARSLAA